MKQDYNSAPLYEAEFTPQGDGVYEIEWDVLAKQVHNDNVDKGFWPADIMDRNVGEALALVHSEITEAYEASLEPSSMDDKLTDYPAVWVEIADAIIRVLDLGYAHGAVFSNDYTNVVAHQFAYDNQFGSVNDDFMELHSAVSIALESHRKRSKSAENGSLLYKADLSTLLGKLIGFTIKYNIPLEVIDAKLSYNRSRPYMHGKKY